MADGDGDGRRSDARTRAGGRRAAVVVDPRMRSRRIHVRRSAGRRRLKRVYAGAGAGGGSWSWPWPPPGRRCSTSTGCWSRASTAPAADAVRRAAAVGAPTSPWSASTPGRSPTGSRTCRGWRRRRSAARGRRRSGCGSPSARWWPRCRSPMSTSLSSTPTATSSPSSRARSSPPAAGTNPGTARRAGRRRRGRRAGAHRHRGARSPRGERLDGDARDALHGGRRGGRAHARHRGVGVDRPRRGAGGRRRRPLRIDRRSRREDHRGEDRAQRRRHWPAWPCSTCAFPGSPALTRNQGCP